ncbi:hypothetical protein Q0M94_28270 (plasmid) [Deinococcus radiomollis]|uniref:hypothetical protein n=1 Tax=Deinococcus radiomollis TaxID=468916 RepID=UPI003891532C
MNPILPPEPLEGQTVTFTFPNGGGVLYETRTNGVLYRVTAPDATAAVAHLAANPTKCRSTRRGPR